MGALVGLGVGVGLLLVWAAFALPPSAKVERRSRLQRVLAEAGLTHVGTSSLVAMCVVLAAGVGLVVQLVTATPPIAVCFALIAGYTPIGVVHARARRRAREFAVVWPEAVDNLASAVRAGLSLPEALGNLGSRGPEPLRSAFDAFATDYQLSGRFGDCLDRLKERLSDPVGDRVVEGLRVAREVGGGELGRLLRNLSGYLRDEARTRSEMESRQAWTINGARLAVAAPWAVLRPAWLPTG